MTINSGLALDCYPKFRNTILTEDKYREYSNQINFLNVDKLLDEPKIFSGENMLKKVYSILKTHFNQQVICHHFFPSYMPDIIIGHKDQLNQINNYITTPNSLNNLTAIVINQRSHYYDGKECLSGLQSMKIRYLIKTGLNVITLDYKEIDKKSSNQLKTLLNYIIKTKINLD